MRRLARRLRWAGCGLVACGAACLAQTGSAREPVRYLGGVYVDENVHDGRLRPVVGASSFQVMRANRTRPELGDGFGWTYSHAPMLAYWNSKFHVEYLSNPVGEHEPPGQTLVVSSADGRRWGRPVVAFPAYRPPPGVVPPPGSTGYMMHQRMGFFVAPNGRLLLLAFYGHAPNPFRQSGIGRVVREMYRDAKMGPIYFLRYNTGTPWREQNTAFPFYTRSPDPEFVAACEALLSNQLMVEQWRDEDPDAAVMRGPCSSLSFFHRPDGVVAGVCKQAFAALSIDEGASWSAPVRSSTFITNNAKMWGQRTPDGRYALVYNPVPYGVQRWPLAVAAGDDGIVFTSLNLVHGEVPARRFLGRAKDFGSQYVRGIAEGNGDPGEAAFWVAYSMNKEDIWISRIPAPIRERVAGPVADRFDDLTAGGEVPGWNLYSPKWAPVAVEEFPNRANRSLALRDRDPYDYARAVRVFPEGKRAQVRCRVQPKNAGVDPFEIEVMDRYGNRPVRIVFTTDGWIGAVNGGALAQVRRVRPGQWHDLHIAVDASRGRFDLTIDGTSALPGAQFAEAVLSVERVSFRTGPYRNDPSRQLDRYDPTLKDLPGADEPAPEALFYVDDVTIRVD